MHFSTKFGTELYGDVVRWEKSEEEPKVRILIRKYAFSELMTVCRIMSLVTLLYKLQFIPGLETCVTYVYNK